MPDVAELKVFFAVFNVPLDIVQHWWSQQKSACALTFTTTPDQCQAYVAAGKLSDVEDELDRHMDWPDRPVLWFDLDGVLRSFTCVSGFWAGIEAEPQFVPMLLGAGSVMPASQLPQPVYTAVYWPDWSGEDGDNHGQPFGIQMDDLCGNNLDMHWYRLEADRDAALDALRAPLGGHEHEVVIDIDSDGILNCRVPPGVRVRVFDRSHKEPATFLYTADGAVERQPLIKGDDDEESGGDVCDSCRSSDVLVSQTCPACGKTLCAECAADYDGLCGDCAAEEAEADDGEDDEEAEAAE